MITHLSTPVVEACKFRLNATTDQVAELVSDLMATRPADRNSSPFPLVLNTKRPLFGLAPLGHEAVEKLTGPKSEISPEFSDLDDGDVIIVQARPDEAPSGGSTPLGAFRKQFFDEAVRRGYLEPEPGFRFLWVNEFPLFGRDDGTDAAEPGQGGRAGLRSTHHPFTAPLAQCDFDALASGNPLAARADHYDLVVNGVELGGGSRRIHVATLQEWVLREVLGMDDAGVARFAHLLEALRAGCPPHAGIALGFDRLVALLSGTDSVRDVIAFPKNLKGEDLMVKSPGKITSQELETYHLAFRKKEG